MTHWSSYFIGAALAVFPALIARGGVELLHRKWRSGLVNVVSGLAALILGLAAIPVVAVLLARSDRISDPTAQGRRVAELAINLAYDSFWIALLGIPVGVVFGIRAYVNRASHRHPLADRNG